MGKYYFLKNNKHFFKYCRLHAYICSSKYNTEVIEATVKTTINKPISEVYQYTIHPGNAKLWYSNVKESEWQEGEAIEIGKKAHLLTNIMGKDYHFNYLINEMEVDSKFKMSADDGAFPMESEYLFKPISDHATEVTVITRAKPKGVPFFMVGIVKDKVQKTLNEDIDVLKKNIEAL